MESGCRLGGWCSSLVGVASFHTHMGCDAHLLFNGLEAVFTFVKWLEYQADPLQFVPSLKNVWRYTSTL